VRRPGNDAPQTLAGLGDAVLDALPISLYVVDRDLRVVAWNRMRERGPLGRPRSEALGRHLRETLTPQGFRATLPVLESVLRSGVPHEETTETRDGTRLFHVRRLPVRRGGRVSHVLSWFDDITERRAMEMRLIASDRLAFLGQLVAGVAHEVSNPLAGIAGCAEALASLAAGKPSRKARREAIEFRDLIRGEVARCERIVRSLLDTARSTAGSTAELSATVGTTLRLLERHPAFARVKVVSRIPQGLPAARIDPDSLKQVVMALAINAAKAMPGGGTLTLKAGAADGRLLLDVVDSGPGVPATLRSRIFEPFFSTDSVSGSGLGLAIARSLVRGRGGDLVYRPRARPGGSFRVVLAAAPRRA
jgi:two-component system NtrC family sensor kinase